MNGTQPNGFSLAVWQYVPPVIVVVGTIGHILIIIAVNGSKRRATSFTIYLTALAVVDALVLYTQTFNLWLQYAFGINIKESRAFMCKLNYFLGFLFIHISSWLVACLTIERTICMYFPRKVGQLPGPKVGITACSIIVIFFCALNAHVMYGRDFELRQNKTVCGFVDQDYKQFFYTIWNKTHFIIYFCLPISIIILGNSAIVIKVYRSSTSVTVGQSNILRYRTRQVFLITFLISVAFVILVPPLPMLFFIAPVDVLQPISAVFYNMLFLNHAINFFLYVLSGSRFRKDLKDAFRRCFCRRTTEPYTGRLPHVSSANILKLTESADDSEVTVMSHIPGNMGSAFQN